MPARATKTIMKLGATAVLALGTLGLAIQAGAQPATPPGATSGAATPADVVTKGRDLFASWSCNSCHTLSDAGAEGHVGPSLDGDPNLTEALVVSRVTNGQGAMPAFGGQMSDQEIATIAKYVKQVAIPAK